MIDTNLVNSSETRAFTLSSSTLVCKHSGLLNYSEMIYTHRHIPPFNWEEGVALAVINEQL